MESIMVYCLSFSSQSLRANNAKINFREKEKKILDQILGTAGKYDARIRPSGVNGTGEYSFTFI